MSDAREVVARAMTADLGGVAPNAWFGTAGRVLAALAADPDTVQRAARAVGEADLGPYPWPVFPETEDTAFYYRAARAVLATLEEA